VSAEKVILLLGRRDEPTDGVVDSLRQPDSILGVTQ
jgi:hypothetical protein